MRKILLFISTFTFLASAATATTYQEKLRLGVTTTQRNDMNVPFVKPKNWKTPFTTPENWPIFENRGPVDRSSADKPFKVLVLGTFPFCGS